MSEISMWQGWGRETLLGKPISSGKRTLLSALVLAGSLYNAFGGLFPTRSSLSGSDVTDGFFGGVTLGLSFALWFMGLKVAGRGWRRALFLTAFSASLVWLVLQVPFAAHDAYEGFLAGWRGAKATTATSAPAGANPFPQIPQAVQAVTWLLLTLILARLLHHLERHRAEAERQRTLAKAAQGQALAARLAPHFIFNALNTLHAQIEADPKAAQATTERLAEIFRQVMDAMARPLVSLKQELAFVEAYLGIEQDRLGRRLQVTIQIPEELDLAEVPPLSLQVLVENAIKHGVTPLEQGGEVRIGGAQRDGWLHVWVEDPGPGISTARGTGTALETLRQRLEQPEDLAMGLEGGRHRVSFRWRQA
ncbi:MAG: histidine kinase [Holophagaceae bacterium]|nr:histidine kinase [Holophagaceae bacterium]